MYCDSVISKIGLFILVFLGVNCEQGKPDRYEGKSFSSSLMILKRNVTCGELLIKGLFTSETWICQDIRVNGLRIGFSATDAEKNVQCPDLRPADDVYGICLELMKAQQVDKKVWAAVVTNSSCHMTKENRVLIKIDAANLSGDYYWSDVGAGHGFITTLQCATLDE